ncbi:MAG: L-fucose:H+ symporter permease [Prevotella sp.]|nr:L-fucose:H+ symporter permease [Prevotella sp.]MDD4534286.1 L-fucose:H+ symporter permease [Prevotella sp.]
MNQITAKDGLFRKDGVSFLLAFLMITICFALWGFANDVTNPLVSSFGKIFQISKFQSSFVQVAFYLGYFCMAFPAAIFIQRYSFKSGVMLGLLLYAVGALAFIPARNTGMFYAFLPAYFIMTCGLSFLETSCNPYVYTMGSAETATRRLNFAQAFNPIGAITGAFIALTYVSAGLDPTDSAERGQLMTSDPARFEVIKAHDLDILVQPYLYIGIVIFVLLFAIWLTRMPKTSDTGERIKVKTAVTQLMHMPNYRNGVIAQFFYVGAQTVCWAYIMYYGIHVFRDLQGLPEATAHEITTRYYLGALALFAIGRFVCTYFLKFVNAGKLLSILAVAAMVLLVGTIFVGGMAGLWCLVAVSGCMSLMFPTIYGIALTGVKENVKFAGAGLVMSILGGSIVPPVQAAIMDVDSDILGLSSLNISFLVPMICFLVVAMYGLRSSTHRH